MSPEEWGVFTVSLIGSVFIISIGLYFLVLLIDPFIRRKMSGENRALFSSLSASGIILLAALPMLAESKANLTYGALVLFISTAVVLFIRFWRVTSLENRNSEERTDG